MSRPPIFCSASQCRKPVSSYDPVTGYVHGAVDEHGNAVRFVDQGDLSILGGDSWKWLLVSSVMSP